MKINRIWAMPSKWTFTVKPIKELIDRYIGDNWADPFAGENSPASITNDIENRGARFQMDGLAFLKIQDNESVDGILFDPPYSAEQCLRLYTAKYNGRAGRAEYLSRCKAEIARILTHGGLCISFGWDSTGTGKKRGFEIEEILLICHGACHNDTIITVDRKVQSQLGIF